jgi:hypothetical protein
MRTAKEFIKQHRIYASDERNSGFEDGWDAALRETKEQPANGSVASGQSSTNTASLKLPTKVVCIQACSIGKHSDSEWQKGFDIGLSAMYDFISGQLRA